MSKTLDFWFSIGSTYTYLTVVRIDEAARQHGCDVRWRPFNLRPITQSMNNRPFVGKPAKMAYMWRDIERRASWRSVSIHVPAPYPLEDLELANRVAIVADQQGWLKCYVTEAYRLWMVEGQMPGSEPNLSNSIAACGHEPEPVLKLARAAAAETTLAQMTEEAKTLGVFGSPTFAVGSEIFWGDDRLEDALRWQAQATP